MKIKTVHITNYRKIIDAKINMEDNITVIVNALMHEGDFYK